MCGVPTQDKGGAPLRRDGKTAKRIASEAVKTVYQHTESKSEINATDREKELLEQRRELGRRFRYNYASAADDEQRAELARRFRQKYGSADPADAEKSNVYPYFIGVFDTVASLANPFAIVALSLLALVALAIPSAVLAATTSSFWVWFGIWFGLLALAVTVIALIVHTSKRIRSELGFEKNKNWRPFHLTEPRMKFYDTDLNPYVSYARHAISIDECRKSFQRVLWGSPRFDKHTQPEWFEQVWFPGNHSDIGGGYLENESRLSDISLKWMLDAAVSVGMKYDSSVLKLYPDPAGPRHDETRSSIFRYFGKLPRKVDHNAPLHPSVIDRFKEAEVLDYDTMRPYRPENLRNHDDVKENYPA